MTLRIGTSSLTTRPVVPRFTQHSTAKLIHHGLLNTNRQNNIYYGKNSAWCPICLENEENMEHVLSCQHPTAASHRKECLDCLQQTLNNSHTPTQVIDAITYRQGEWTNNPSIQELRVLTAGSLWGADAILTTAFREQHMWRKILVFKHQEVTLQERSSCFFPYTRLATTNSKPIPWIMRPVLVYKLA